jgi:hypothetical protein
MPATEQTVCFITDILPQITGMLNKALWIKLRSQINDATPAFRFQVMQQNETEAEADGENTQGAPLPAELHSQESLQHRQVKRAGAYCPCSSSKMVSNHRL